MMTRLGRAFTLCSIVLVLMSLAVPARAQVAPRGEVAGGYVFLDEDELEQAVPVGWTSTPIRLDRAAASTSI